MDAVELLLLRMDMHPKEFSKVEDSPWTCITSALLERALTNERTIFPFFTDEEIKLLSDRVLEIHRREFSQHLLEQFKDMDGGVSHAH